MLQLRLLFIQFHSVQFSSVTQSCPTLCDPMKCSTPDLPVHHQLQESTQSLVHHIDDAIQPSHPLSSPSPPTFNLSLELYVYKHPGASLIAQSVTNLPAVQETWVQFLGCEDPMEKEMATHSSLLAWRIPWIEEPGGQQSMGLHESNTT